MRLLHRFFVEPEQFDRENPVIYGSDVNHISRVLRLRPGDQIEILDGNGRAAIAGIETINKQEVILKIIEEFNPGGEPPLEVTLVQGLSKGEKMDLIVQKATELGASAIIPAICHRSVARLDGDKSYRKQERWQRVAMEAAKQCRRSIIPKVHMPQSLAQVLSGIPQEPTAIMPWEGEKKNTLEHVLSGEKTDNLYIFIGPEGGFEPFEVEHAVNKGVSTVTLGRRILRTETAGLACLAIVMFQWGDLK